MATYKRRFVSLMILVIGFFLGGLGQLTIEGKNIESTGGEKNQEDVKGYKVYFNLAERNLEVTTSGQYYVICTTTSTPYRIIVENAVRDVEIIMQDVNIDVSKQKDVGGIEIHGSATLTLKGTNSVMGGRKQTCILVTKYGDLTISEESTGSLLVEGGEFASAIGAQWRELVESYILKAEVYRLIQKESEQLLEV
ncbi:hypothetical protein [Cellulosilyticum ruminicola]|uniref:hypothetical protein n=1 Tax=Cellulosilyticum ruminicola TaxID=425254 RepID=UPI0006D08FB7|nr:hypothetical protein [Cellulosilyticum ruminicola]